MSSAALIQWEMAPQIAPDPNHGGQPDLPNTSAYVNPPDGYEVLLDASHSRGIRPSSSFNWTISQSSKVVTTVQGEKPDVDLPEGTYTVQLIGVQSPGDHWSRGRRAPPSQSRTS